MTRTTTQKKPHLALAVISFINIKSIQISEEEAQKQVNILSKLKIHSFAIISCTIFFSTILTPVQTFFPLIDHFHNILLYYLILSRIITTLLINDEAFEGSCERNFFL